MCGRHERQSWHCSVPSPLLCSVVSYAVHIQAMHDQLMKHIAKNHIVMHACISEGVLVFCVTLWGHITGCLGLHAARGPWVGYMCPKRWIRGVEGEHSGSLNINKKERST